MNIATQLLINKFSYAMGWTLLHSFWQAALVAGALYLFLFQLKKRNADSRYWLSVLSFATLAVMSVYTFVHHWQAYQQTIHWLQGGINLPELPVNNDVLSERLNGAIEEIVLLWFVGFAFCIARYIGALVYCRKLISNHDQRLSPQLLAQLRKLKQRMGVNKNIQAKLSSLVDVPCVIGHFKPVLLLPMALVVKLDQSQLEAVLLHELAHIKRNDYLVGLIQNLIKSFYFFNPAMYLISRQIDNERENVCDDMAVHCCGDAMLYSRTLQQMASLPNSGELTMAMTGKQQYLMARIKRQFEIDAVKRKPFSGFMGVVAIVVSLLMVATNAVGSAMPKLEYKGIDSLTDEQVAELIILARDSVVGGKENVKPIRSTVLNNNARFKKMSVPERQRFNEYLRNELWRFMKADDWGPFLEGSAPEGSELAWKNWILESNHLSRFRHLNLAGKQTVSQSTQEGGIYHNVKRYEGDYWEVEISVAAVEKLMLTPDGDVSGEKFAAIYRPLEGVYFAFGEGELSRLVQSGAFTQQSRGMIYESWSPDEEDEEIEKKRNSHLEWVVDEDSLAVKFNDALLARILANEIKNAGTGYEGLSIKDNKITIVLDVPSAARLSGVVKNIYLAYAVPNENIPLNWSELNERIARLSEEGRQLLYTDEDFDDFRYANLTIRNTQYSDEIFQSVKFSLQEGRLDAIESGDAERIKGLSYRPAYMPSDRPVFVAIRNFPPNPENALAFDLDLQSVTAAQLYHKIQSHCPEKTVRQEFAAFGDTMTLRYRYLDCDRVDAVLEQIANQLGNMHEKK